MIFEVRCVMVQNKKSIVKGIVLRRRDLVINGESQVSTTFKNKKIEDEIITILEKLKLINPVIMLSNESVLEISLFTISLKFQQLILVKFFLNFLY